MAGELQHPGSVGATYYAHLLNTSGQRWNGSAFEAYNEGSWGDYVVPLTEQGDSGLHVGDMPAVPAGVYGVLVYQQSGGSPAVGDAPPVGEGELDWTGSAVASIGAGGGGASPADVWSYASRTLTQSAAQVATAVEGDDITVKRGDDLSISLTDIGSLVGRTKLWFTVKRWYDDADDDAVLMIVEGTGLTRLNGAAGTAGQGSVTVTDEATGDLTVVIAAAASAQLLPRETYLWDVQALLAGGVVTRVQGAFTVVGDVTRAVS